MALVDAHPEAASDVARLLVVDDEEDIVRIFRQFLEENGYQVDCCFNGKEACERIRSQGYDLVITDMVMSPVRGEEVLRAITEHSPDTEVIVITAFATFERIQEALRRHVYDFVEKPVDLHHLSSTVRAAIAKARESKARRRLLAQLRQKNAELIEEVCRATRNLEPDALEDAVTGLPGYQAFRSILETEISRAIQTKSAVSLSMLRLDGFAEFNRNYGRENSDTLLREMADVLRASLRKTDILFRYGTDQLAVVFPATGTDAALQCTRRLLHQVTERSWQSPWGEDHPEVILSAGVATAPRDGANFDDLVRVANRAVELAKQGGSNRIHRA